MNKLLLILLCHLFIITNLFSQSHTEDFEISYPDQKVENSLYSKISFVDIRYDTTHMGIVQLGAFNRKAKVIPKPAFEFQLQKALDSLTDSTRKQGELLFLMRQFSFAEVTGAMSEKGYCYMRAELYAKTDTQFKKIDAIDTVVLVKSMDVTRGMFRRGSKMITGFISDNLLKESSENETGYSYFEIKKMDSLNKRKIPVYNTDKFTDGIYSDYASFSRQVPDITEMEVKMKDDNISSVKVPGKEGGKSEKVKSKDVYAVVYQGNLFIATDYDFYPLEKKGDNFYFTGQVKTAASNGDVVAATVFFGIIGGLIASEAGSNGMFRIRIDYQNGGFIRLREVKRFQN